MYTLNFSTAKSQLNKPPVKKLLVKLGVFKTIMGYLDQ